MQQRRLIPYHLWLNAFRLITLRANARPSQRPSRMAGTDAEFVEDQGSEEAGQRITAVHDICVAGHVVASVEVTCVDAAGNLARRKMVPLTPCCRFRKDMTWAASAMNALGVHGLGRQDFKSAPVVQDIVAAINAMKGARQKTSKLFAADGAPLPTSANHAAVPR